jgi:hypothetical protein
MSEGRTEIDIVSGMPAEMVQRDRQRADAAEDKSTLLRQMGFMGVSESQAADVLLGLIEERLTVRVTTLVSLDPEAKSLVDLLKRFGERKFSAQLAAQEMVKRYARKE